MAAINCGNHGRAPAALWTGSEVLAELERDGDASLVRDLIHVFLDEAAVRICRLREAAGCTDFGVLAEAGHAIKGSALAMNAARLAELSRQIEEDARLRRERDYAALVDGLEEALGETREAMMAYAGVLPQVPAG